MLAVLAGTAMLAVVGWAVAEPPKLGTRQLGETQAIRPPALDDRSFDDLHGELAKEGASRVPVHAPEWTDATPSDPGARTPQPATGEIRFGDGLRGRPPTGGNPAAGNDRHGGGQQAVPPIPIRERASKAKKNGSPRLELRVED